MPSLSMAAKCLLLLCVGQLTHALRGSDPECESGSMRLPRRVRPNHYDLELRVDVNQLKYSGRVEIELEFDRLAAERDSICKLSEASPRACNQKTVVLHADQWLEIERVDFIRAEAGKVPRGCNELTDDCNLKFCRDHSNSQLLVTLRREFKSKGFLVINFGGEINDDKDVGFYKSDSVDSSNRNRLLVLTQFESGNARTAFPCFDEPDLKATFSLTIEHAKGLRAVSNTPPLAETSSVEMVESRRFWAGNKQAGQLVRVQFEKTPPMSTYLLAYAVGELEHIEAKADEKMTIGVWTAPGRAHEARPSLETAIKAYRLLVDYFGFEQPIGKIDFLSADTFAGAMENWGLITFQSRFLLDSAERRASVTPRYDYYALNMIARALAHHWFGNLVTMQWWDDLWLNEGLTTWMAEKVTNQLFPHHDVDHYFLIDTMVPALEMDADSARTHPIKNLQVQTVAEIDDSFDLITDEKASCVLRMLNAHLGDQKFDKGLRNYITRHQYKNTQADDLWAALAEVSDGLDVDALMDSWIYQAGFPLVRLGVSSAGKLRLSQRKFPDSKRKLNWSKQSGTVWKIPISFWVSDGRNQLVKMQTVLENYENEIELPEWFDATNASHWVKANAGFGGFYRVVYDRPLLGALRKPIEAKIMSPADRMNIVSDHIAMNKHDLITGRELLELFEWFKDEDHELVLYTLVQALDSYSASDIHENPFGYEILKKYHKNNPLVGSHSNQNDQQHESLLSIMARSEAIFSLVRFNYQPALEDAIEFYRATKGQVTPYMQPAIYSAVAVGGTEEEFLEVLKEVNRAERRSRPILKGHLVWALKNDANRLTVARNFLKNQPVISG